MVREKNNLSNVDNYGGRHRMKEKGEKRKEIDKVSKEFLYFLETAEENVPLIFDEALKNVIHKCDDTSSSSSKDNYDTEGKRIVDENEIYHNKERLNHSYRGFSKRRD